MNQLAHGAEAVLLTDGEKVIKERLSKGYRIAELDSSLRRYRTRREAKILNKLAEVNFPSPRCQEMSDQKMTIAMDFINGQQLKEVLHQQPEWFAEEIGRNIAQLHQLDIVHGDLTTSNMIVNGTVHFIDFGLSSFSSKVEDKAVDLFLLDRALVTTHAELYPHVFEKIIDSYHQHYPQAAPVLQRLAAVRSRGRNKKK